MQDNSVKNKFGIPLFGKQISFEKDPKFLGVSFDGFSISFDGFDWISAKSN